MTFTEQFKHLDELASELEKSGINEEHYKETKCLLQERQVISSKISKSISMSKEKFYKPFDL